MLNTSIADGIDKMISTHMTKLCTTPPNHQAHEDKKDGTVLQQNTGNKAITNMFTHFKLFQDKNQSHT